MYREGGQRAGEGRTVEKDDGRGNRSKEGGGRESGIPEGRKERLVSSLGRRYCGCHVNMTSLYENVEKLKRT